MVDSLAYGLELLIGFNCSTLFYRSTTREIVGNMYVNHTIDKLAWYLQHGKETISLVLT